MCSHSCRSSACMKKQQYFCCSSSHLPCCAYFNQLNSYCVLHKLSMWLIKNQQQQHLYTYPPNSNTAFPLLTLLDLMNLWFRLMQLFPNMNEQSIRKLGNAVLNTTNSARSQGGGRGNVFPPFSEEEICWHQHLPGVRGAARRRVGETKSPFARMAELYQGRGATGGSLKIAPELARSPSVALLAGKT